MALEGTHHFGPNNGRPLGVFGIVLTLLVVGSVLSDGVQGSDGAVLAGAGLAVVLLWCLFLRPRITVDGAVLRLRNSFSDVVIPLVAVDRVVITMFTMVESGDRSYRSAAVSRSRGEMVKRRRGPEPDPMNNTADLVEARVSQFVEDARAQKLPGGPVTVRPAWVEVVLLAGLAGFTLVLLLT